MKRTAASIALISLLTAGCESSARVDCQALDVDACLAARPDCLWAGGASVGDCRNTCDLAEPDCEENLTCVATGYYDPDLVEQVQPFQPACSPAASD